MATKDISKEHKHAGIFSTIYAASKTDLEVQGFNANARKKERIPEGITYGMAT